MRAAITLLILSLSPSLTPAAEVWRWVNPQGNVEYSDTPRPGAERIELSEPTIVPPLSPTVATPAPPAPDTGQRGAVAIPYREIAIADPGNDDTLRDNGGNLIVSVRLDPPLQTDFGHRVQLLLDGTPYETAGISNFPLTGIDRGTHTLQAVVLDRSDQPLMSSEVVSFHLHRTTVQQIERNRAAQQALEAQRAR